MAQYIPPAITADDIFRLSWFGRLDGQRMMWVLHFRCTSNIVSVYVDAMQALANALATDMVGLGVFGDIRTLQSDELNWEHVQVQRIFPTRDVYFSELVGADGGVATPAAPPNVCLSVTNRTNLPGEHGIGRSQLPGFPLTELDEGLWSTSLVDDVEVAMNIALTSTYNEGLTNNDYRFGVLGVFAADMEIQDITECVAHNTVRTMHRRTVGLGE